MKSEKTDLLDKKEVHEQPKKSYTTPQLTIHGNVEEITQSGGGPLVDAGGLGSGLG